MSERVSQTVIGVEGLANVCSCVEMLLTSFFVLDFAMVVFLLLVSSSGPQELIFIHRHAVSQALLPLFATHFHA